MTKAIITEASALISPQWSLVFPTRMTGTDGGEDDEVLVAAMEPGLSDQDDRRRFSS